MGLMDLLNSTASGLATVATGVGKGVVDVTKGVVDVTKGVYEAWEEGRDGDDDVWKQSSGLVGRPTERASKGARPFILPQPADDGHDALVTAALAASDDDQQTAAAARVDTSVARAGK